MKKLTHQELQDRQLTQIPLKHFSLCVLLDDIRSAENVGSIFRTADAVGVEKLWLCGITCAPPNPLLRKTALDAQDHVPWGYDADAVSRVKILKNLGYQIVALEQTDASIPVQTFQSQSKICLIVGHEVTGVRDELIALCDSSVEIQMDGVKNAMTAKIKKNVGIESITSTIRMMTVSTQPR